jgi:hypothetical protein
MMVRSRRYAGGIEVALPNEDLVREAFAALSRGNLDWLQRQYLAQDIRCHFRGGAPGRGLRGRISGAGVLWPGLRALRRHTPS